LLFEWHLFTPDAPANSAPSSPISDVSDVLEPARFRGQPLVLVFTERWQAPDLAAFGRLRAELRGLGAALVLFAPGSVVCLRADDAIRVFRPDESVERCAFEALLPRSRRSDARRRVDFDLSILDSNARLCWRGQSPKCDDPLATLLAGLSVASREVVSRWSNRGGITRRELLASMVAAFALTLGDGCRPHAVANAPGARGDKGATHEVAASLLSPRR